MRSPSPQSLPLAWRARRRGNALLEFALVSLVLYLLLAGTVEFGRALFVAQGLQDAARVAARELALTPLPAQATWEEALADERVREQVFAEEFLVVDLATIDTSTGAAIGADPAAFFARAPLLNRALWPHMIVETVDLGAGPQRLLRYPGALVLHPGLDPDRNQANPGLSVLIPVLAYDPSTGQEQGLSWVQVVEQVAGAQSEFPLRADGGGLVQLRVNYPFQAAALTFHGPGADPTDPFDPNLGQPVEADDAAILADPTPIGTTLVAGGSEDGAYGGVYGLGRLRALGQEVRPFRRVLSGQAIFRREVFQ